jgi:formylmethanofuran:tetrahydromethanopterin formyltransferase
LIIDGLERVWKEVVKVLSRHLMKGIEEKYRMPQVRKISIQYYGCSVGRFLVRLKNTLD